MRHDLYIIRRRATHTCYGPVGNPGSASNIMVETLSVQSVASLSRLIVVPEAAGEVASPRPDKDVIKNPPIRQRTETAQPDTAQVLHVGCGVYHREKLPAVFHDGWREIRLDIDPEVRPDVVASITDMRAISDRAVDAVYSSHNIEHLYPHEVPLALREMRRVLKPDGVALIKLPDLQEVARHVADGKLEDPLYTSPMGPIAPLDILYGHRPSLASGNTFMAHRTGFTGATLGAALIRAGFAAALVQRDLLAFCLIAVAFRSKPGVEDVTIAQARMLFAADQPAVLYAAAAAP
jgi:hypothetical protein